MKKLQSVLIAAVIAISSFDANCDIIRLEFDAVVTFVSNQNNMPNMIKVGDVFSGYVDMEPELAPPNIFSPDQDVAMHLIAPATQDWIEAEVSIGGNTFSTTNLIGTAGAVAISDLYPSLQDDYSITSLNFSEGNASFILTLGGGSLNSDQMPSLPDFIDGNSLEQNFTWNLEPNNLNPPTGVFSFQDGLYPIEPNATLVSVSFSLQRVKVGSVTPTTPVDLSGTIKAADGTDICAMVLASGKYMFSCNPNGPFRLYHMPRESDGTVKRQIYADGFFPKIDILTDSIDEIVVMTRSGACPSYNTPYDPAFAPDSADQRINITGKVFLQSSQTPVCAMVLANGQHMFSCDGTGSYALNIPLDTNGQFKLQVYADGFAPTTQKFDESSANNDVRMARSVECQ